jgi:hypothetical protein
MGNRLKGSEVTSKKKQNSRKAPKEKMPFHKKDAWSKRKERNRLAYPNRFLVFLIIRSKDRRISC